MAAIDQVTGHYNANRRQFIDVPEWAGEDGVPLRVYWELLTIERRKQLLTMQNRSDVDTLVALAQDADGKPLFGKEDKPKLKLAADAAVITRIAARMLGVGRLSEADVESAEKN